MQKSRKSRFRHFLAKTLNFDYFFDRFFRKFDDFSPKTRSHYYRGPPFWPFLPYFGHFPAFLSFIQKQPFLLKIRFYHLFLSFIINFIKFDFSAIFSKNGHFSLFFIIFLKYEGFQLFSSFSS